MVDHFVNALYLNPIISWLVTLTGILVLLLPAIAVWTISKRRFPDWQATAIGVGFGLTVVPLSLWLYMQFFVGPIRALVFGFLGLFMMMLHMVPLSKVTIPFLLEATDTTKGAWGVPVLKHWILGGTLWGTVYGFVGLVIDKIRKRKKSL